MSKIPSETNPETNPPAAADADDPLASLYKMSRTAGLGSQEYVAVNATAVVTLLLGLASGATVMGTFLLTIPAVAIVVGVVALMQIRNSAGTQTGKGIAWLGILLALGFVARVGGSEYLHARKIEQERGRILQIVDQFSATMSQGKFDAAWDLFSSRLKGRVPKESFVAARNWYLADPRYGKIKNAHSNGIVDVDIDQETGAEIARTLLIFDLANGIWDKRTDASQFRKENGDWYIDDLPFDLVPPGTKAQAQPQPQN